jgi:catechol 2,3-dioxygenase-like lactoylglutathione lyase family enzyme
VLKLEVVSLPVADVDAALRFYVDRVGFALDVDYRPDPDFRVVQLTPPGSACSVHLERAPDEYHVRHLTLVTDDIETARTELVARGVDVGAIRHKHPVDNWGGALADGIDPHRRDYSSFAEFRDPDGNAWSLQERGFAAR